MAKQLQRDCHRTLPRLISVSLDPKNVRLGLSLILLLFCTLSGASDNKNDDSPEVTTKVFDHDYDGGKRHSHTEVFYRRGNAHWILMITRTMEAGVTKTERGYAVGDMLVGEIDDDGDGIYETLIIENTKTNDLEVFSRRRDGTVYPVDAKTLALTKQQRADLKEFWDKAFDKDFEFVPSAKALREKLQKEEKEKTKEQK